MQKYASLTLALAVSLLFAANAAAQDHIGHAGHGTQAAGTAKPAPGKEKETVEQAFARFDADKNGFVEKSELPAKHPLLAHFGMADKNRDGKLDPREFKLGMSML